MKFVLSIVFASLVAISGAQNIVRVPVRHADPLLIAHLIKGNYSFILPPEISCVLKLRAH